MISYCKLYQIHDKWYLFNGNPKEDYLDWADGWTDIFVLNKLQEYRLITIIHEDSLKVYFLLKIYHNY
jgi:hypothetical protein